MNKITRKHILLEKKTNNDIVKIIKTILYPTDLFIFILFFINISNITFLSFVLPHWLCYFNVKRIKCCFVILHYGSRPIFNVINEKDHNISYK